MRRSLVFLFLVAVLTLGVGQVHAAATAAPLSTPELKKIIGAGKKTVVFFLNPQGGPCKAQNEILQQVIKDRKGSFSVAYVDAMKAENQRAFYDYGVRNLPQMVLVDSKGKIAQFFPPGIQSYDALATALDSTK
ncbi:MAG: thioredoxin family protein [Nitrospirota bacterium]